MKWRSSQYKPRNFPKVPYVSTTLQEKKHEKSVSVVNPSKHIKRISRNHDILHEDKRKRNLTQLEIVPSTFRSTESWRSWETVKEVYVGGVKYTLNISTSPDAKKYQRRPGYHKSKNNKSAFTTYKGSPYYTKTKWSPIQEIFDSKPKPKKE